jgi:hypothetical protein
MKPAQQAVAAAAIVFGMLACEGRSRAANQVTEEPQRCEVSQEVLFGPGSTSGTVDLNCDGAADSISISRVESAGVLVSQVTVGARAPYLFRALDGLPHLLEAVDIDGDGTRDLVLALIDESTVLPLLLRVTDADTRPFGESKINWRQLQYAWSANDDQDSCRSIVTPRTQIDSQGFRYLRLRAALGNIPCDQAPSIALVVRNGELLVDSALTRSLRSP